MPTGMPREPSSQLLYCMWIWQLILTITLRSIPKKYVQLPPSTSDIVYISMRSLCHVPVLHVFAPWLVETNPHHWTYTWFLLFQCSQHTESEAIFHKMCQSFSKKPHWVTVGKLINFKLNQLAGLLPYHWIVVHWFILKTDIYYCWKNITDI